MVSCSSWLLSTAPDFRLGFRIPFTDQKVRRHSSTIAICTIKSLSLTLFLDYNEAICPRQELCLKMKEAFLGSCMDTEPVGLLTLYSDHHGKSQKGSSGRQLQRSPAHPQPCAQTCRSDARVELMTQTQAPFDDCLSADQGSLSECSHVAATVLQARFRERPTAPGPPHLAEA